jgi:hypothetical protein
VKRILFSNEKNHVLKMKHNVAPRCVRPSVLESPTEDSLMAGLLNVVLEMLVITIWEGHKNIRVKKGIPVDMINVPRKASLKLLYIINEFSKDVSQKKPT